MDAGSPTRITSPSTLKRRIATGKRLRNLPFLPAPASLPLVRLDRRRRRCSNWDPAGFRESKRRAIARSCRLHRKGKVTLLTLARSTGLQPLLASGSCRKLTIRASSIARSSGRANRSASRCPSPIPCSSKLPRSILCHLSRDAPGLVQRSPASGTRTISPFTLGGYGGRQRTTLRPGRD
jgi:hypothetical protein